MQEKHQGRERCLLVLVPGEESWEMKEKKFKRNGKHSHRIFTSLVIDLLLKETNMWAEGHENTSRMKVLTSFDLHHSKEEERQHESYVPSLFFFVS